MQRTRYDPNLAALQASTGLPGHVVDVVVLTVDTGLLATLREASGPEHAIWHAQSADAAVDLLVGGRCGILIADLATLRGDAAALLDRLHSQFPELILLATGRRDEEHSVAALVGNQRVYRFLHKPVSPARASLFIATATRRYTDLRHAEPIALTTIRTVARRPNFTRTVAVIAAVAAAIAVFSVWLSMDRSTSSTTEPQPASTTTRSVPEQVAELLASAQMAIATDRLAEPKGNNAVEYFRKALALQPSNAEARAGLDRVLATLEARVVEALQARDAPKGAIALRVLQHADPKHPRLDQFNQELLAISRSVKPLPIGTNTPPASSKPASSAARPASQAPAATSRPSTSAPAARTPVTQLPARTEPTATAPEAQPQASTSGGPSTDEMNTVRRLRERGLLIEPAGENAYDRVIGLRERYPDSPDVRTEQQRLMFVLLERTRTALAAGDLGSASALLQRADVLVPGMEATKSLQQQLAATRVETSFMKDIVRASTLKRTREVDAVYPRDAERNGVEGWVDVEFTIAADGSTQDLVVSGAQPPQVFDNAAVDAVKKWRFAPIVRDGTAVPQRALLRVQFVVRD